MWQWKWYVLLHHLLYWHLCYLCLDAVMILQARRSVCSQNCLTRDPLTSVTETAGMRLWGAPISYLRYETVCYSWNVHNRIPCCIVLVLLLASDNSREPARAFHKPIPIVLPVFHIPGIAFNALGLALPSHVLISARSFKVTKSKANCARVSGVNWFMVAFVHYR